MPPTGSVRSPTRCWTRTARCTHRPPRHLRGHTEQRGGRGLGQAVPGADLVGQPRRIARADTAFYQTDLGTTAPPGWHAALTHRGALAVLLATGIDPTGAHRAAQLTAAGQRGAGHRRWGIPARCPPAPAYPRRGRYRRDHRSRLPRREQPAHPRVPAVRALLETELERGDAGGPELTDFMHGLVA